MSEVFYNLSHPNKYARAWAANKGMSHSFWGYPSRNHCKHGMGVHVIVVHTAENIPDFDGADSGAEAVSRFGSNTSRAASWHGTVDSDSKIWNLPSNYLAFHVRNYNSCGVGQEIATQAHKWVEAPLPWITATLTNSAEQTAEWAKAYDIPPVFLTRAQVDAGQRGFTSHSVLDPTRRSDPGQAFPWDRYLGMVHQKITEKEKQMYEDRTEWPSWALQSIEKAIADGVMVGSNNKWFANQGLTRAEMAVVLDRLGLIGKG